MSEVVAGTESAAPADTASIASTVMETLENDASDAAADAGDTGDPGAASGDTAVAVKAETPGVVKPAPSEAEQLLQEAGITEPRRQDGRENRIPYSKVVKIIENGLKAGKGQFGQQFAAAQAEVTTYRGQVERVTPILQRLDDGPEAFVAYAAKQDPRWKAFLEARQAPAAAQAELTDLPDPDFALPDGSKTYSMRGIRESLVPYIVQQARKEARAAAEAQYRPIAEREKATQERERATQAEGQLRSRVQSQIEDAKTWDGYSQHEPAILAALQADSDAARAAGRRPTLTLEGAYRQVVLPALKADEAAVEKRVLDRLKAAPTGTSVSRSGPESVSAKAGTRSTADVAREVYDKLNRG